MRIALLGSTGYVGSEFTRQIVSRGHQLLSVRRTDVDIFNQRSLTNHLESRSVDWLINCAGYTGKPNVDACEDHKSECLAGNAVLPGIISSTCSTLGFPWGHVSSGCIYTGSKPDGSGFT